MGHELMPTYSITTTARTPIFTGDSNLQSLAFKNSSTTGILYLKNLNNTTDTVSSTSYDHSLTAGQAIGLTLLVDGEGAMMASWSVVSDTVGGVTLDVMPIYRSMRSH